LAHIYNHFSPFSYIHTGAGSPLSSLIPAIEISHKAALLPLTYEYLRAVYKAVDLSEYVIDLIRRNPDFNVPVLDMCKRKH